MERLEEKALMLLANKLIEEKYINLAMLKNIINHLYERKTQNQ